MNAQLSAPLGVIPDPLHPSWTAQLPHQCEFLLILPPSHPPAGSYVTENLTFEEKLFHSVYNYPASSHQWIFSDRLHWGRPSSVCVWTHTQVLVWVNNKHLHAVMPLCFRKKKSLTTNLVYHVIPSEDCWVNSWWRKWDPVTSFISQQCDTVWKKTHWPFAIEINGIARNINVRDSHDTAVLWTLTSIYRHLLRWQGSVVDRWC